MHRGFIGITADELVSKEVQNPNFREHGAGDEMGSHLNVKEHARLIKAQHAMSNAALGEWNLQRKVSLATQSQLMREAAEHLPRWDATSHEPIG